MQAAINVIRWIKEEQGIFREVAQLLWNRAEWGKASRTLIKEMQDTIAEADDAGRLSSRQEAAEIQQEVTRRNIEQRARTDSQAQQASLISLRVVTTAKDAKGALAEKVQQSELRALRNAQSLQDIADGKLRMVEIQNEHAWTIYNNGMNAAGAQLAIDDETAEAAGMTAAIATAAAADKHEAQVKRSSASQASDSTDRSRWTAWSQCVKYDQAPGEAQNATTPWAAAPASSSNSWWRWQYTTTTTSPQNTTTLFNFEEGGATGEAEGSSRRRRRRKQQEGIAMGNDDRVDRRSHPHHR